MDVQPQVGVGDEEELGVVVATEVSPAAGAQVALDQVVLSGSPIDSVMNS